MPHTQAGTQSLVIKHIKLLVLEAKYVNETGFYQLYRYTYREIHFYVSIYPSLMGFYYIFMFCYNIYLYTHVYTFQILIIKSFCYGKFLALLYFFP